MRIAMAALACGLMAVHAWAADPGPSIPAEAFFKKPAFSEPSISPTGRHVALLSANKDGQKQLVVVDTATLKAKVAAVFSRGDVAGVQWVNEKRLVFSIDDREHEFSEAQ